MIQNESKVIIADNTWAKTAKVIRVLDWSFRKSGTIWTRVVVAIKTALPGWQVQKWDVARGIIVRTRKEIRRSDGSYIRFWDNAIAIIDESNQPKGKRIFWPVARELREKGYKTIANLAEEVI